MRFAEVAIKVPLPRTFDYKVDEQLLPLSQLQPGMRVLVPFGNQRKVAVILSLKADTEVPEGKIKSIIEVIDDLPVLSAQHLELLKFTARYYCYPLGENAGIGGALYGHYLGFVSAEGFTIMMSIQFLAMIIIGGLVGSRYHRVQTQH